MSTVQRLRKPALQKPRPGYSLAKGTHYLLRPLGPLQGAGTLAAALAQPLRCLMAPHHEQAGENEAPTQEKSSTLNINLRRSLVGGNLFTAFISWERTLSPTVKGCKGHKMTRLHSACQLGKETKNREPLAELSSPVSFCHSGAETPPVSTQQSRSEHRFGKWA